MISCDTVIIREDPVGLFQVLELGLLGVSAHAIDAMPHAASRCELYPDKPIHAIPALPVCSGRELIERLRQQIRPLTPTTTSPALQRRPGVRDAQRYHVVVRPPPRMAATAA